MAHPVINGTTYCGSFAAPRWNRLLGYPQHSNRRMVRQPPFKRTNLRQSIRVSPATGFSELTLARSSIAEIARTLHSSNRALVVAGRLPYQSGPDSWDDPLLPLAWYDTCIGNCLNTASDYIRVRRCIHAASPPAPWQVPVREALVKRLDRESH